MTIKDEEDHLTSLPAINMMEEEATSSVTAVDVDEVHETRELRNHPTFKLRGTEHNLTLEQTGAGRCDRCKKYGYVCTTRLTDEGASRVFTIRCDHCRETHRPASDCNVDVTPVSEKYPGIPLLKSRPKAKSVVRSSSTSNDKGKRAATIDQEAGETSKKSKKTSSDLTCRHIVNPTDNNSKDGCMLDSAIVNQLVARTLLRQSITGIENDTTGSSPVVRAFLPGLKSAYELLFPDHPLEQ